MTKQLRPCAILTMDSLDDFEVYDYLFDEPLRALGWQTHLVSWRAKNVNWQDYEAVIIRSPWDYQDDAEAFMKVIDTIDASSAHLENSADIVRWNIDKIYLQELANNGVNIVRSLWRSNLKAAEVSEFFQQLNVEQLVIKPRISANADNTFWLTLDNYQASLPALEAVFSQANYLVQPFMESVINEGEYSLFYFNGEYSHCILKTPKQNDFRVQEEHGGVLKAVTPEAKLFEHADETMQALANLHETPLYARIDFVRDSSGFALMEAELIEPSLYFNADEASPKRFAQAFDQRMRDITL